MANRASFAFVFIVVLIDMLGFGIIMPVLPKLIMQLGNMAIDQAAVYAGWLGAGYALAQFVFAPIIGNLSDRFGRRPILLISVLAMAIDYSIQGFAPSLGWLVFGRLAAGMAGASWSAAYSYIADVTPPENRAASFGTMGMAFGIGFVAGPALGGLLTGFGDRAPFHVAAALAFANFVFGLIFVRESLPPENRRPFEFARANAFAALKALRGQSSKVAWFIAASGIWQLAHVVYPAIFTYFAMEAYGFSPKQVGLALGVVGLSSALVQGVGLRLIAPRLGERLAVALGVLCFAVSAGLYAIVHTTPMIYLAICVGAFQGFIGPSITAAGSRAVGARSQGELQGAMQSISSIAQIIGPPLYAATFAAFSGPQALAAIPAMPLLLAAVFAVGSLVLFYTGTARIKPASEPA